MYSVKRALSHLAKRLVMAALLIAPIAHSAVQPPIALLDFELHELTPDAQRDTQGSRAKRLGPMLAARLEETHGLKLTVPGDNASVEDVGIDTGVFDKPAAAGKLGRELKVEWLISCQLYKDNPRSFYLSAQLIDVARDHISADIVIEVNDEEEAETRKGITTLAAQITDTLKALKVIR